MVRKKIPVTTADQVMFDNDHTCCICRVRFRPVQIHHIDGNPNNNSRDNLSVLCLEHHNQATYPQGFSRRISPGEIRKYKTDWEEIVRSKRAPTYKGDSKAFYATICGYGSEYNVEAVEVVIHDKNGKIYNKLVVHRHDCPLEIATTRVINFISEHGVYQSFMVNRYLPIDYCPHCQAALSQITDAEIIGIVEKGIKPNPLFIVYTNPNQCSLLISASRGLEVNLIVAIHLCSGGLVLQYEYADSGEVSFDKLMPENSKYIKEQIKELIWKVANMAGYKKVSFFTGDPENPEEVKYLILPSCWFDDGALDESRKGWLNEQKQESIVYCHSLDNYREFHSVVVGSNGEILDRKIESLKGLPRKERIRVIEGIRREIELQMMKKIKRNSKKRKHSKT